MSGVVIPPGLRKVSHDGTATGDGTTGSPLGVNVGGLGLAAVATSGSAADLSSGILPDARMPDLTGDVTSSDGAVATTIAANAVTNAKLAQAAALTVKGNATNATANDTDIASTAAGQTLVQKGNSTLVWALPNVGLFGTGFDGALTYDGAATILGVVPAANVYTLTRDVMASAITINNGVTIKPNGFRMVCSGTFTNNGTIAFNGGNGATVTAGLANANGGNGSLVGLGSNGGAGANGNAAGGNGVSQGTNHGPQPYASDQTGVATPANTLGSYTSGGGGGGGGGANAGGTGGLCSATSANAGFTSYIELYYGTHFATQAQAQINFGNASGGGGGASNGTTGQGGGGGAGAGFFMIAAVTFAGNGTFTANGGNGGNAAAGNSTAAGGGGGGGGGLVVLIYLTNTGTWTATATGGTHGTPTGTGQNGGNGHDGLVIKYNLSGDGT